MGGDWRLVGRGGLEFDNLVRSMRQFRMYENQENITLYNITIYNKPGEVSEWSIVTVSKTVVR